MRRAALVTALVVLGCLAASAQQPGNSLNPAQALGRRIFQQRCAVCHTQPTITSKTYGPVLYKGLVEDNEDQVRETITNGSTGLMPGFRYGLRPSEIDAVIEYLKTVDKPAPAPRQSGAGSNM
jgi:mono/diheme cytochrome c family protein